MLWPKDPTPHGLIAMHHPTFAVRYHLMGKVRNVRVDRITAQIIGLSIYTLLFFFSAGLVTSYLSIYMYEVLGITLVSQITLLLGLQAVIDIPFLLVSGWLADYGSPRRLLILGALILLFPSVLLSLQLFPLASVVLALFGAEISGSVVGTITYKLVAAAAKRTSSFGRYYGIYSGSIKLSGLVSGFTGGMILEGWGYIPLFTISALALAISLIAPLALSVPSPARDGAGRSGFWGELKDGLRAVTSNREILLFTVMDSVGVFFFMLGVSVRRLYVREVISASFLLLGLLLLISGVSSTLMGYVSGLIGDRAGLARSLFALSLPFSAGMLLLVAVGDPAVLPIPYLLFGISEGSYHTLAEALNARICPEEYIGRIWGIQSVLTSLMAMAGTFASGMLWDLINPAAPLLVSGIVGLIVDVLMYITFRRY